MRVLLAPAGSRGDVQPMLALGVGLRAAGHAVLVAAAPNFAAEAQALGLAHASVGRDALKMVEDARDALHGPIQGVRFLSRHYREELRLQFDGLFALEPGFDLVVGAGAQLAASSVAERWQVPYRYVAYFPELLPSRSHAPVFVPYLLPSFANRALWAAFATAYQRLFGKAHNAERVRHGLLPVPHVLEHLGGNGQTVLAVDPELAPVPPDLSVSVVGALHLSDPRPIPEEVERFLQEGAPPVYLGFGSMPDPDPQATTELLERAVLEAGVRAIISTGWAKLAATASHPDILFAGPLNHGKLFPRLAAAVHHGGAGTTSAAARGGLVQVVVPHSFDQFGWARRMVNAGVSPGFVPRSGLHRGMLAALLRKGLAEPRYRKQAQALAATLRSRDSVAQTVKLLEAAVAATDVPATSKLDAR